MIHAAPIRLLVALLGILVVASVAGAQKPTALVYEFVDRYSQSRGAARLLEEAKFAVTRGDLAADYPGFTVDVIMLGSFVSESPDYAAFMQVHVPRLVDFVAKGGIVWQWTQADQREARPPFLPAPLRATRADPDHDELFVFAPGHPLLAGLAFNRGPFGAKLRVPRHLKRPPNWETLKTQSGFRVLLASFPEGRSPALIEAAHGKGRFVLTSLFLDKLADENGKIVAPPRVRAAAAKMAANLARYAALVRSGDAPDVSPTPPHEPPAPLPFAEGSWTLVALPDTQVYVMRHPKTFDRMTAWIAAEREKRNIAFVVHVGDLVNNNNAPQWEHAKRSMALLDGKVDYAIAPGNHDLGPNGSARNRSTMFNQYFSHAAMKKRPTFGGVFPPGRLDNSFHRFEAGGEKWLVVALEFGPRKRAVLWANRVIAKHADHRAIVVTHAFTYSDDTRYDHEKRPDQYWNPHGYGVAKLSGGVNDGEELWTKLASRHASVRFVLSGHVLNDGLGRLVTTGKHGNRVHQILANYQNQGRGGDGYLRLMEFLPGSERVQVKTYSPLLDRYKTDPQNQFVLELGDARR